MLENLLAKDNGVTFVKHSKATSDLGVELVRYSLEGQQETNIDYEDIVRTTLLVHDIGKLNKKFQKLLKSKKEKTNEDEKNKYTHNEISYAFVTTYLNHKYYDYIRNATLFHHSIKYGRKINELIPNKILSTISDQDLAYMKEYVIKYVNKDYLHTDENIIESNGLIKPNKFYSDKFNPNNFVEDYNVVLSLVRMCVISADRIVSQFEPNDLNYTNYITNSIKKENPYTIIKPQTYNQERFDTQKNIAEQASQKKTTVVKAVAGFGKTLTGLLWNSKSDKKLLWVCPRNVVAESVYHEIIEELNNCGINNVSVELYLTGERQKQLNAKDEEFSSDIIVTNIDNFLKPNFDDKLGKKNYFINSCDIVFDEFHEFVTGDALFSLFINFMRLRNCITNSRTMLLSATPSIISYLWSTLNNETLILPNNDEHYKATHNKPYHFRIGDGFKPSEIKNNELYVHNTIKGAQEFKRLTKDKPSKLIHSRFNDKTRESLFTELLNIYGKHSDINAEKPTLISTLLVQASLNISVKALYDSVLSPETLLQRIGRTNRFGTYSEAYITLCQNYSSGKEGEAKIITHLYDIELSKLWYNHMVKYDGRDLTLDEIYIIYNDFNKEQYNNIRRYIIKMCNESQDRLSTIHPIKKNNNKNGVIVYTVDSNKLRSSKNSAYIIAKNKKDGVWGDVFCIQQYEYDKLSFDEIYKKNQEIEYIITKELNNDTRFSYSNNIDSKHNRKGFDYTSLGRRSDTPIPILNMEYCEILGLVEK